MAVVLVHHGLVIESYVLMVGYLFCTFVSVFYLCGKWQHDGIQKCFFLIFYINVLMWVMFDRCLSFSTFFFITDRVVGASKLELGNFTCAAGYYY